MEVKEIERVRLMSIQDGRSSDGRPAWVVTMAFFPNKHDTEPMLTTVSKILKSDYDDADVVRVARHYFQGICGHLAEEVSVWKMDEDDLAALKK